MKTTAEELIAAGYSARREGRPEDARAACAQAVEVARGADRQMVLAEALIGLGQMERDMGETDSALLHYEAAEEILRGLGEPLRLAHTVRHVGDILREQSRVDAAALCYEEALGIYRGHAETKALDLANTLRGCALLKEARREGAEAKPLWEEARGLYESVGVRAGVQEAERRIAVLGD